jgi:hypothetical protein
MGRVSLYLIGIYGLVAAFVVYMNRKYPRRQVPVGRLAAQLQDAWADHRTRA